MNNDILPRKPSQPTSKPRPLAPRPEAIASSRSQRAVKPHQQAPTTEKVGLPPIEPPSEKVSLEKRNKGVPKLIWAVVGFIVVAIVGVMVAGAFLLSPKNSSASLPVSIEITSGMLPGEIADTLESEGVIRSSFAFKLYARLSGVQNSLQAGSYMLSPADSTPEIAKQLQKGPTVEEIEIMFKPGATLADNKKVLLALGYSADEVDAAFATEYDHPLFTGKPEGSDLEGYIFGETHRFRKGVSVKEILERYFDDYYAVIQENNLIELYQKQNLSLFEGITLASIVQRESGGDDKAQIAQVFLLRLSEDMQLGSDVTYQYIADKEGMPRDVNYDSPYNTRVHTGLPPGPIASPGVTALKAVGNPAEGNYLFFLSGDDDITYFAHTLAEHEANIRNHCQQKCAIL